MAKLPVAKALFAVSLEMASAARPLSLKAQAKALAQKLNLQRRRAPRKAAAKGAADLALAATAGAEAALLERPLSAFAQDMNEALRKARRKKKGGDGAYKAARDARIEQVKSLLAAGGGFMNLGLSERQVLTLGALCGEEFGRAVRVTHWPKEMSAARVKLLVDAQESSSALSRQLLKVWDQALPPKKDLEATLKAVFDELRDALAHDPELRAGEFVRKKLFDNWRGRFMRRLHKDSALVKRLKDEAGIVVEKVGDDPHLVVDLMIDNKPYRMGLDIDHSEVQLAEAVQAALNAGSHEPLSGVVRGSGLQLSSPDQNRTVFNVLRGRLRAEAELAQDAARQWTRADQDALMLGLSEGYDAIDKLVEWSP